VDGRDDARAWASIAAHWRSLGNPYQVALARWREAEAILSEAAAAGEDARQARTQARTPLLDAYALASELGALPLAGRLAELAGRALISLPDGGRFAARASTPAGEDLVPLAMGTDLDDSRRPASGGGDGRVGGPGDRRRAARSGAGGLASVFAGPPAARRRDTFGLSSREREVLGLIVDGRTNREIGEHLFISQKTVGVHVGNILAKLGVSGRVEAATAALRLGLAERV
jgi:DNA-binding CsgD family transcriptional regulator